MGVAISATFDLACFSLQVYDRDLSPYNNLCVTISDTSNNFEIVQRVLPTIGGNVTTVQLSVATVLQYSFQHQWNITLSATDLGCNTDTFTTTSSILACSNTVSALTGIATVIIDVGVSSVFVVPKCLSLSPTYFFFTVL